MSGTTFSCSGVDVVLDPAPIGSLAPDFDIGEGTAAHRTLAWLRGQTVVLVFSRPEWDPARAEQLAQYNRVLEQAPGLSAELIGLSSDGCAARFEMGGEDVRLPLVGGIDPSGSVARAYGVEGLNALFVIDEEGIVRWRYAAAVGVVPNAEVLLTGLRAIAPPPNRTGATGLTRRQFLAAALATAFVLSLPHGATAAPPTRAEPTEPLAAPITLHINGAEHTISIDPRVSLLDALRERIGLTGSKKGCDHGQCGSCTVHVDGRRVISCLTLAIAAQGKQITTVEGIAHGPQLHRVQEAFIAHDAFQCGYCTPGQIMSAVALLDEHCGPDDADVREAMSGNICRCGAYPNIVDAIQAVRKGATGNVSV